MLRAPAATDLLENDLRKLLDSLALTKGGIGGSP